MRHKQWFSGAVGLLLLMTLLAGCGSAPRSGSSSGGSTTASPTTPAPAPAGAPVKAEAMAPSPPVADAKSVNGAAGQGQSAPARNTAPAVDSRKLVYTADVNLQVTSVEQAIVQVQNLADFYHGYVSGMRKSGTDDAGYNGIVTLRIPTDSFSEVMGKVRGLATKVKDEKADVQDVTNQFVDLESRLKAAREHEATLRTLAQKSGTLDELLRLQNEIERVRAQIETMQGAMNVLSNQIAFSTINVSLIQPPPEKKPEPLISKKGLGKRISDAWNTSVTVMTDVVTGLIVMITALLLPLGSLGIVAFVIWWLVRRFRGGSAATTTGGSSAASQPKE